jgi:hypothetical protein
MMISTVESLHYKFLNKLDGLNSSANAVVELANKYEYETSSDIKNICKQLYVDYQMATVGILAEYYKINSNDDIVSEKYNKKVTMENFVSRIDELITKIKSLLRVIEASKTISESRKNKSSSKSKNKIQKRDPNIIAIENALSAIGNININLGVKSLDSDHCKCGAVFVIVPEYSEKRCINAFCGRIKIMTGNVFKDDLQSGNDLQKSKCNGYDFNRHFNFWMERLQALEHKSFPAEELAKINACITRDKLSVKRLNCRIMRGYLKETGLTEYNDHIPLLVKTFGSKGPPQYEFTEIRDISIKFNKIINLYHKVNPNGSNRPYYPYFIYKIVEEKFKENPEKLRLLDFIHLQSEDTIKKNDEFYKQICELSAPEDGLVYKVTNPFARL